jgi:hypothetical protein
MSELASGRSRRRSLALAITGGLLALATIAPAAAQAGELVPKFWLYIGDECVSTNGDDSADRELIWRDSDGALKAHVTLAAGSSMYCSSDPAIVVEIGDRLRIKRGSDSYVLVVPALSIQLRRVTDRVVGTAPPNTLVRVECDKSDPFRHFEPCVWKKKFYSNADGTWATSVPFDFIGGAEMAVRWQSAAGDEVRAWATAPYVQVTLGRSIFRGATRSGGTANVSIGVADGTVVGDSFDGEFLGQFRDGASDPIAVQPGMSLTTSNVSMDANWVVPGIDAAVSVATDEVSGRCYDTGASAHLVNVVLTRSGVERGWALVDTEVDGSFAFNFRTDTDDFFWTNVNVRNGDRLTFRCMQSEGDWVQKIEFATT